VAVKGTPAVPEPEPALLAVLMTSSSFATVPGSVAGASEPLAPP
jgi:hypothetical protein